LTDKWVTAKDALRTGYVNEVLDVFDKKQQWFDPNTIPVIPKLLATDFKTLINCMKQINASKNVKQIEETTKGEA
jgi:hypothetical protein